MGFLSTAIHWPLDLESGNEPDDNGGNILVANNSPTFRKGVYGTARDLEASSSQYFSLVDNAAVSTGNIDFTVSCLVNAESITGSPMIVSKFHSTTTSLREFQLFYSSAAVFRWQVTDGTSTGTVSASNFGALTLGVTYRVTVWHDSVNDVVGIQVNTTAETPVAYSAGSQDTAAPFIVGARDGASVNSFWDGTIQDLWFDKRVWTAGERAAVARGLDPRLLP